MTDLITRLEAAAEGSRELDRVIAFLLLKPRYAERPGNWPGDMWGKPIPWEDYKDDGVAPPLTTSIDSAVALVREKAPLLDWTVRSNSPDANYTAMLDGPSPETPAGEISRWVFVAHTAATPALALMIALLRALTPTKEGSEDAYPVLTHDHHGLK